ncbi:DEAD/DEAH box helicase, partial [Candidatus Woesearchaeota archaeon]|nr:DEAD/DEAH box helicase [Candidatus Woesearchaeota archaeon]
MKFKELGLDEPLLAIIEEKGFEQPTEIQERTIPLTLESKDVIAESATGSGKTLAFSAGMIMNIHARKGVQALVLAPTRELASQVAREIKQFSKGRSLRVCAVYGGVGINPQFAKIRESEIVVGTPGRILDHMQRRTLLLDDVKFLVLDEADRMLDMGFRDDIERIISQCPTDRQTLLFSATISEEITQIAKKYQKHPVKVKVKNQVDPKKLKQVYYDVNDGVKFSLLVTLLKSEPANLSMIFCNTQRNVDFVAKNLAKNGVKAQGIHGGISQARRTHILQEFYSDGCHVLVCTDVAARGLDIKGVSHVYNFDLPDDPKQYVHRIGRTARAGSEGMAVNVLTRRHHDSFRRIMSEVGYDTIKKMETPFVEKVPITTGGDSGERDGRRNSRGGSRDGYSRGGSRDSRGSYSSDRPRNSSEGSSSRGSYSSDRPRRSSEGSSSRGSYSSDRP